MLGKKTGGRKKGTPNKISKEAKPFVVAAVSNYYSSQQFREDLDSLEPKDRLAAIIKLSEYVLSKLQSTTIDIQSDDARTIEDRLTDLSGNWNSDY